MNVKPSLVVCGIVVAAWMAATPASAPAQAERSQSGKSTKHLPSITVAGSGEAHAAPDIASINMGLTTQARTPAQAVQANNQRMQAMLETLKQRGVQDRDVQTSNFSISPNYQHDERGQRPPTIVGYNVTNQVTVRVRKLSDLGALLDAVVQDGANEVHGISFSIDDPKPLLDKARLEAMRDALRKAELYAAAAGATVGRVIKIEEQIQGDGPIPLPMQRFNMMAEAAVPIASGEQTLEATIVVTYELVGAKAKQGNKATKAEEATAEDVIEETAAPVQ